MCFNIGMLIKKEYKWDVVVILMLFLLTPLFFYKLGQSSLVSFDEAWYGEIARNIIKNKDPLNLSWNGQPYIEHPPGGFWLIAIAMAAAGESELVVRFAPAILGFLSLVVIYFLGKELFGRAVGFASALGLSSSFWFLFRSRSGNLDSILTFFFLLTLLLAIKSTKNERWLIPFSLSLTFLFLTKALVPFTIIPVLILIFWKSNLRWKDFIWPLTLFLGIFGGWFLLNIIKSPIFFKHYLITGSPGVSSKINYLENLELVNRYLHSGIGKWFWPGIFAIAISPFLKQKPFLILTTFFLTFFLPFLLSNKGHIWHLIPLHPIMIVSFFGFSFVFLKKFIQQILIVNVLIIALAVYVSLFQIKIAWNQFINIPAFISDEEILSEEAGKFKEEFFIDGDFEQTAVFYSKKNVKKIFREKLTELFESKNSFLLITYQWRLDEAKISKDKYEILKKDRDKILIKSTL